MRASSCLCKIIIRPWLDYVSNAFMCKAFVQTARKVWLQCIFLVYHYYYYHYSYSAPLPAVITSSCSYCHLCHSMWCVCGWVPSTVKHSHVFPNNLYIRQSEVHRIKILQFTVYSTTHMKELEWKSVIATINVVLLCAHKPVLWCIEILGCCSCCNFNKRWRHKDIFLFLFFPQSQWTDMMSAL